MCLNVWSPWSGRAWRNPIQTPRRTVRQGGVCSATAICSSETPLSADPNIFYRRDYYLMLVNTTEWVASRWNSLVKCRHIPTNGILLPAGGGAGGGRCADPPLVDVEWPPDPSVRSSCGNWQPERSRWRAGGSCFPRAGGKPWPLAALSAAPCPLGRQRPSWLFVRCNKQNDLHRRNAFC